MKSQWIALLLPYQSDPKTICYGIDWVRPWPILDQVQFTDLGEQAIDAYYKALQLKPTFVRARYNLGVSCINIGCYKEAAEHFLGALDLHVVPNQGLDNQTNVSRNLWDTLRKTFLLLDRKDLAGMAHENQDVSVFRNEFEF